MLINPYIYALGYDADAQAFFNATGISDTAEKTAINNLVVNLKSYSLWTQLKAIYPFRGGTATTCKYNLKDPQNTDGAFRLTFSGGWTFGSTGALPNGTNAYADTHIIPNSVASINGASFGIYSRTNNTSATYLYGVSDGLHIDHHNMTGANWSLGDNQIISYTGNPTTRFLMVRRNASGDMQAYRDGTSLGTNTNVVSSLAQTYSFYFGARNNFGTPVLYTPHELAFAFFGIGLTNQNALDLTTCVNSFVTELGINV